MCVGLRVGGGSPICTGGRGSLVVDLTELRGCFLSRADVLLVPRPALLCARLWGGFHTIWRLQG